jgi:hypothetical protein
VTVGAGSVAARAAPGGRGVSRRGAAPGGVAGLRPSGSQSARAAPVCAPPVLQPPGRGGVFARHDPPVCLRPRSRDDGVGDGNVSRAGCGAGGRLWAPGVAPPVGDAAGECALRFDDAIGPGAVGRDRGPLGPPSRTHLLQMASAINDVL